MVCIELVLEKLERQILKSRAWNMMVLNVDIGVRHPKNPKFRPVRFTALYPDKNHVYPLAVATDNEILFNEQSFAAMSPRLVFKIMKHELIHLYLVDNGKDQFDYQDDCKLFEKCAKYLKANVIVRTRMVWRLPGQKRWRR